MKNWVYILGAFLSSFSYATIEPNINQFKQKELKFLKKEYLEIIHKIPSMSDDTFAASQKTDAFLQMTHTCRSLNKNDKQELKGYFETLDRKREEEQEQIIREFFSPISSTLFERINARDGMKNFLEKIKKISSYYPYKFQKFMHDFLELKEEGSLEKAQAFKLFFTCASIQFYLDTLSLHNISVSSGVSLVSDFEDSFSSLCAFLRDMPSICSTFNILTGKDVSCITYLTSKDLYENLQHLIAKTKKDTTLYYQYISSHHNLRQLGLGGYAQHRLVPQIQECLEFQIGHNSDQKETAKHMLDHVKKRGGLSRGMSAFWAYSLYQSEADHTNDPLNLFYNAYQSLLSFDKNQECWSKKESFSDVNAFLSKLLSFQAKCEQTCLQLEEKDMFKESAWGPFAINLKLLEPLHIDKSFKDITNYSWSPPFTYDQLKELIQKWLSFVGELGSSKMIHLDFGSAAGYRTVSIWKNKNDLYYCDPNWDEGMVRAKDLSELTGYALSSMRENDSNAYFKGDRVRFCVYQFLPKT